MKRLNHARILMYSHDTFGLGHLRRCRTIAHAMVERFKGLTVIIISGSQIAGAFGFKARVDFVKIPSVIKLLSGDYASVGDHIDIKDTLAMREALILETARLYNPDIFVVDKEPMGLHNEVESTLIALQRTGCRTVLGLRDVMDSPKLLSAEWDRKGVVDKVTNLYDEVWIYGPEDFWDPLQGLNVPKHLKNKTRYMGFLEREASTTSHAADYNLPNDFLLVTAGGGGDGMDIMSWVLAARENDSTLVIPLVLVTGPFMKTDARNEINRRAAALENTTVIEFDSELESIMKKASAVAGMCGYNTFCELISFDIPSLYIPRTQPREEQLIRATRATELGIAQMLEPEHAANPEKMSKALRKLMKSARPSAADWSVDMNGLSAVGDRVELLMEDSTGEHLPPLPATISHTRPLHEDELI